MDDLRFEDYTVEPIKSKIAKEFIREKHYSKSCHNGPSPCYGLFIKDVENVDYKSLIGVLCFATPCSENVRSSVFGEPYKDRVTELHRLFVEDSYKGLKTPTNTESWFISRCLKNLKRDKPQIWAVITFADSTEGHKGTIYKATNAKFCGMTSKATFYLDRKGSLRHPRQNGVNITVDEAITRGWCPVKRFSKARYLYLLPDNKGHKKKLERSCRIWLQN
jgi:hypothetical protein